MRAGIMLAHPYEKRRIKEWECFIMQPKLNGQRCRVIVQDTGNIVLLSSEGHQLGSVPHIIRELRERFELGFLPIGTELDGELYLHGLPLNELRKLTSPQNYLAAKHQDVELHLFDMVSEKTQTHRLLDLAELFNVATARDPKVRLVSGRWGTATDDLMLYLNEQIEQGYEGVILRHPEGIYERKRSKYLLKIKPRKKDCYQIVGYNQEVSIRGEPKEAIGSLILTDEEGTQFKVGTGPLFTRCNREALWHVREHLAGHWAVIKYERLSGTTARNVPYAAVLIDIGETKEEDEE